jgi:hypothetical protein
MSGSRAMYTEEAIISAVKRLLVGRVNKVLAEVEFYIPEIEFGNFQSGSVVVPVVSLSTCERTEKERVIRLDAYTVMLLFPVPDTPEAELQCYAYSAAVDKVIRENRTLDGTANRAVLIGKKYIPPKKQHCGEGWEVVLTLRVTVEETGI